MEIQEIHDSNPGIGGANVNESGVLTCAVQQPVDGAVQISWDNGATYTERWKGAYQEFKHITSGSGTAYGTVWKVGQKRPSIPNARWHALINPPEPLKGMAWVVDTIQVNETNPPGDHAYLDITYKACLLDEIPTYGGYGGRLSADNDDVRDLSAMTLSSLVSMNLDERKGWDLTWGTFSRSVLEYCTDPRWASTPEETNSVDRVLHCAQFPKPTKKQLANSELSDMLSAQQYTWIEVDTANALSTIEVLQNEKERQIYNLYCRGVQPTFHYPILTYSESWNYPKNYPRKLITYSDGGQIDYKVEAGTDAEALLLQCPIDLSGWEFVNVGCHARTEEEIAKGTMKVSLEYRFEGALSVDERFYGNDETRWIPGQLGSIH